MTPPATAASVVLIDSGHGLGSFWRVDNGAAGNGTDERTQVVRIAQALIPMLQPYITVVPIGVTERLSVAQKVKKVNAVCQQNGWGAKDALLVSIHMNAGDPSAHGVEGWYGKGRDSSLASAVASAVATATGLTLRNPSVKPSDQNRLHGLGILDQTIPNSCLLEAGFVTNAADVETVESNPSAVATGIFHSILSFLGMTPPSPTPPAGYSDIPPGSWYGDAVNTLVQRGVLEIPADGLFRPGDAVNRAEMAVMLARLLRAPGQ
jgi:N-acetylmuramoyl-L-alanine amidase